MAIDKLNGGVEGIANMLEIHRMSQVENQQNQQEQNRLSRPETRQHEAQTQTGVAVQGLGENLNRMV